MSDSAAESCENGGRDEGTRLVDRRGQQQPMPAAVRRRDGGHSGPGRASLQQAATITQARPPIAPDEEHAHRGEWVILHIGHIVAHAPTLDELLADDRAASGEYTLYRVPETRRRFR